MRMKAVHDRQLDGRLLQLAIERLSTAVKVGHLGERSSDIPYRLVAMIELEVVLPVPACLHSSIMKGEHSIQKFWMFMYIFIFIRVYGII